MSFKDFCPALLILLGACAAPQQRPAAKTIRSETGALSEVEFLNAPWRSTNIQQTAMADGRVKMLVLVTDENGEPDTGMTEFLETELNALQRFPVESRIAGRTLAGAAEKLELIGNVDMEQSINSEIGYLLEWKLKRNHKRWHGDNTGLLLNAPVALHEYWYEGPLNLFQVGGGARRAIWADRTFRSSSAWKWELTRLDGGHSGLHDHFDQDKESLAYDEARSSILFNFSKEAYSKLGREASVENALKSGADVLMSTAMGSQDGVVQGQPMFVAYRQGNLEVFLAKAIVENPSLEGSTLRVIQWKPGEALAEDFAADPTSFISRYGSAIVARTEGLALPESWSERAAEADRLMTKYVADTKALVGQMVKPDVMKALLDLLESR